MESKLSQGWLKKEAEGSVDSGGPDDVRWQPTKPLNDANVEQSYSATPDVNPFGGTDTSEQDLVRHQPVVDSKKPLEPITLAPERTSGVEAAKKISQSVELADGIYVDRDALQKYLDYVNTHNTIDWSSFNVNSVNSMREQLHNAVVDTAHGDEVDLAKEKGFWPRVESEVRNLVATFVEDVIHSTSSIKKSAQVPLQILDIANIPNKSSDEIRYDCKVRLPRSVTKGVDVRSLNDYFNDLVRDYGWKIKDEIYKKLLDKSEITFDITNQYYPDVNEDFVDFIVQFTVGAVEEPKNSPEPDMPEPVKEEAAVLTPETDKTTSNPDEPIVKEEAGKKYDMFPPLPNPDDADAPEKRKQMGYDPDHYTSKNLETLVKRLVRLGIPSKIVSDTLSYNLSTMDDVFNSIQDLLKLGESYGLSDSSMMIGWRSR